MERSRYVVSGHDNGWQVRTASRSITEVFPSKAQALCAAIELAESDGARKGASVVVVRHEDDHYITEWEYGKDLHPDDAARPDGAKQPGRSGA